MSTSQPPSWPHCAHGADPATDPVGCRGIHVPGHTVCLAHLTDTDRNAYLAGLTPGANIDHRGTTFTEPLLRGLETVLHDSATGIVRFGRARFESATFKGKAGFDSTVFEGDARFESATFKGKAHFESATFKSNAVFHSTVFEDDAWFHSATFKSNAAFRSATFKNNAWFHSTVFEDDAWFHSATFKSNAVFRSATFKSNAAFHSTATFEGIALFGSAVFKGKAWFGSAVFKGEAWFDFAVFKGEARFGSAVFKGDAHFDSAIFERADELGPLVCAARVVLSGATFGGPVTLEFAAPHLVCRRTRWAATAEIRLRYTTVDFAHAVFEYPLTIAAEPAPFVLTDGSVLAEDALVGEPGPEVRVASLRGVDAAHLVLADVDLSPCLFTGTIHLDQLRLEGACTFDTTPAPVGGWRRWPPVRFTKRRVLAEEHHWRATRPGAAQGWDSAEPGTGRTGPLQLAPVYRALRKGFEDGKHEPGAADFYYGEMEMRRHADDIPRAERWLLTAYWALSGYGLRASRALTWLGAAMLLTIGLLMGFGIAQDTPKQTATGTVPPGGGTVVFEIDKDDPKNPAGDRFTGERFEKALNVTLNSVVFRSSGQDLTTAGTYIEMTSRLAEPVLLGLAVLAIRNRVKR
ncbi:pentapeptide repeat-containing protein [Streptomyces cavourensis]|uniref:Pentapeptide repeat-containing protein n=1 Tax=Streptomyces cavourensis TaxID=67258 RepID=A0ABY5FIQ9_9ACTN|nr:pentapeptide repeat-containing protein [Streptomyces cavourensis]UTR83642.1 pentapeptide repeat-containing protein [Streptomyces cavourensis]